MQQLIYAAPSTPTVWKSNMLIYLQSAIAPSSSQTAWKNTVYHTPLWRELNAIIKFWLAHDARIHWTVYVKRHCVLKIRGSRASLLFFCDCRTSLWKQQQRWNPESLHSRLAKHTAKMVHRGGPMIGCSRTRQKQMGPKWQNSGGSRHPSSSSGCNQLHVHLLDEFSVFLCETNRAERVDWHCCYIVFLLCSLAKGGTFRGGVNGGNPWHFQGARQCTLQRPWVCYKG